MGQVVLSVRLIMSRFLLLTVVTLSGLLACFASFKVLYAQQSAPSVALQSVTSRTLAASGVILQPSAEAPMIGSDQAVSTIQNYFPNAQVRERLLARVEDTHVHPSIDGLFWVLSIVPHDGIYSFDRRMTGTYQLVFINASTGMYTFGLSGGEIK